MDVDPFLRRLEWTAIIACLAMSIIAVVVAKGRPDAALAVLGGGLLIALSYRTIGSGVAALGTALAGRRGGDTSEVDAEAAHASAHHERSTRAPKMAWIVMKVFARYALLALLAYVMIARLRLHPLGLLAGASSIVAAASVEACRLLLKKS